MYESEIVGKCIIIQCGCHGSFVGHLELDLEDGMVKQFDYKLIETDERINENAEVKLLFRKGFNLFLKLRVKYWEQQIISSTDIPHYHQQWIIFSFPPSILRRILRLLSPTDGDMVQQ